MGTTLKSYKFLLTLSVLSKCCSGAKSCFLFPQISLNRGTTKKIHHHLLIISEHIAVSWYIGQFPCDHETLCIIRNKHQYFFFLGGFARIRIHSINNYYFHTVWKILCGPLENFFSQATWQTWKKNFNKCRVNPTSQNVIWPKYTVPLCCIFTSAFHKFLYSDNLLLKSQMMKKKKTIQKTVNISWRKYYSWIIFMKVSLRLYQNNNNHHDREKSFNQRQ